MKSPKTLLLTGILTGITLLLSQCKPGDGNDQQIAYNRDNAKVHFISMKTASELSSNFRHGVVNLSRQLKDSTYLNTNFSMPLSEEFNRDAICALLNQKGAKGIRICLGQDNKGVIRMVLVAVNEKGNDITGKSKKIMKTTAFEEDPDSLALESGQRCPTLCDMESILNN